MHVDQSAIIARRTASVSSGQAATIRASSASPLNQRVNLASDRIRQRRPKGVDFIQSGIDSATLFVPEYLV
jgi:hypothetical protein